MYAATAEHTMLALRYGKPANQNENEEKYIYGKNNEEQRKKQRFIIDFNVNGSNICDSLKIAVILLRYFSFSLQL